MRGRHGGACRNGRLSQAIVALVLLLAAGARGDGGALCISERSGALVVSIFAGPVPLRAGPIDVSVLVQRADDYAPVLEADVDLALRSGDLERTAVATHAAATNKVLYASTIDVQAAGRWTVTADARAQELRATASCQIDVAPPASPLAAFWPYLALPFAIGAIFVLHQWLKTTR